MRRTRQGRLHPAQHDALTGLAHRGLGHARLLAAITGAAASGLSLAVSMLDLERFHALNAALGHAIGDRVLQAVAHRLAREAGPGDTVARFGNDEFLVVLARPDAVTALRDAARLGEIVAREIETEGLRIRLRVRAGVALYPEHGLDADTLLRRCDLALQEAKQTQSPLVVYRSGQDELQLRRLAIVYALRDAVAGRQLRLEYQPKLDLPTGRVTQVEALLRWRHPTLGALSPDEFIPLAEQSGQIEPLTRWVLDEVLRQARVWHENGLALGIAVNLSALDLSALDLPGVVGSLFARHGVEASRVTLEITESALMRDPVEARAVLGSLKELGLRLALDDFGVGFSSLSRLQTLPVDELKIDRSFVQGLRGGSSDALLVRSIVELAHRLELRVVAEGVEDMEALRLLQGFGCDVVQGYLVSPPLAPEALASFCRFREPIPSRRALAKVSPRATRRPSASA